MLKSIILPTYCPSDDVLDKLHWFMYSLAINTDWKDTEIVCIEQGAPFFDTYKKNFFKDSIPVTYKHYVDPLGYAKCVNEAIRLSKGEYKLIVNNDLEVGDNWADKLVNKYKAEKYQSASKMGLLSASDTGGPEEDVIEDLRSWWSCVCISDKVWNDVGSLDDVKMNYRFHDQDWSIRAFLNGYRIARYHGVKVKHYESSTYKHMKVDEESERQAMLDKWGLLHFCEYIEGKK